MADDRRVPQPGDLPPPAFVHELAARLPVHQIRRAVAIALALPDVALRSEFVRALRDRVAVTNTLQRTTVEGAAVDVGEVEDARGFAAALEAAGEVVDPSRLQPIVAAVRLVRFAPEFSRWLAPLLPAERHELPEFDSRDALPLLSSLTDEGVRARAIALLAPLVGGDSDMVRLAAGIRDGWLRVTALSTIAMKLPGNVTREAVAAAESIKDPAARVTAVAVLAPYLAYARSHLYDLLGRTLAEVAAIGGVHAQARALAELAPAMRGFHPASAERAMQRAGELRLAGPRAIAMEALLLPWPQPYIPRAEGSWSSDSPFWRAERLADISPDGPVGAADAVLTDLVAAIGPETTATPRMDPGGGEQSAEPGITDERTTRGFAPSVRRPERYVNLGFATKDRPGVPLGDAATLAAYYDYVFWLEIGQLQEGSIVNDAAELLPGEVLPGGARVSVVLFDFPGEIEAFGRSAVAEMIAQPDGTIEVLRQPDDGPGREYHDLRKRRLFFRVRAPAQPGVARLRCNLYYEQNLVQSYLVRAMVTRIPEMGVAEALTADLDYTLARTLDAAHLQRLVPQKLSIMLNRGDDGTHSFLFLGEETPESDAFRQLSSLTGHELQNLIDIGRRAMRKVAWGTDRPWNAKTDRNRYDGSADRARLPADLQTLARAGYEVYAAIIKELAGGKLRARELASLMRTYGLVQIALKERAEHVFPAALMYDHPLDTNADLSICPVFERALDAREALESVACFQGACPSYGDLTVVCPSGFWGYRHALGLPISTSFAPSVPTTLEVTDGLEFLASVSTDPQFVQRVDHLSRIREQCGPARWQIADTRAATLHSLKQSRPHLVYFFCHGGLTANRIPFIEVGPPNSNGGILSNNLVAYEIEWDAPRPIVFMNGCHTTALEPESAISFVTTFVEDCMAAGVIGTEITVFEPLACRFAEECLTRFFVGRLPFGESVRRARLALLAAANPLGLVYIPYVQTGLRLA